MTIHISAKEGEIAKFVLMPGDPLRAEIMAKKFLKDPKLVNTTRNMLMFTGTYKDLPVTIAASGMGNASMGIYSYELFNFYGVENIIRVGTAGAYNKDYEVYSIFNCIESYGESEFAKIVTGKDQKILPASKFLFETIEKTAQEVGITTLKGRAHASDVFYRSDDAIKLAQEQKLDVVEMETYALFSNAMKLNKNAAALFTISDNLITKVETTAEERQTKFDKMFELALETGLRIYQK